MTKEAFTIKTSCVDATLGLGRRIGQALNGGDVIALVGQLGAGKTYLVKGIARGLDVKDERSVNSPTFVLVNEYVGRLQVHHLDAYRLNSADELLDIGFEEMCASAVVVMVEWADRVPDAMPADALWIRIESTGETDRQFAFETPNSDLAARLRAAGVDPNH